MQELFCQNLLQFGVHRLAMLSTPEKDAFDSVLAGSGARKRVVSHRPRDPLFQQVGHIDFEVAAPKVTAKAEPEAKRTKAEAAA